MQGYGGRLGFWLRRKNQAQGNPWEAGRKLGWREVPRIEQVRSCLLIMKYVKMEQTLRKPRIHEAVVYNFMKVALRTFNQPLIPAASPRAE